MAQHLVGLIYLTETGELLRMVQPGDDREFQSTEYSGPGETFSVMQSEGAPSVQDAIDYLVETTAFTAAEVCPAPMRELPPPEQEEPEDPVAGE